MHSFFRCLHYKLIAREQNWRSTRVNCEKQNDCAIRLSSKDNKWLNFKKERVSFKIYADLECSGKDTDGHENIQLHISASLCI